MKLMLHPYIIYIDPPFHSLAQEIMGDLQHRALFVELEVIKDCRLPSPFFHRKGGSVVLLKRGEFP